jgi:DNA-binding CsgD family transcriptional regulator
MLATRPEQDFCEPVIIWSADSPNAACNQLLREHPSASGRLCYLSSLRNPNNGQYGHSTLTEQFGRGNTDETLRKSHRDVFVEWLNLDLKEQKADLDRFFSTCSDSLCTIVQTWISLETYRTLIPAQHDEQEKRLFVTQVDLILKLMGRELGIGALSNSAPGNLTQKELKVYELLTLGKANKEIAGLLEISARTVRFHVSNILSKFSVGTRCELIAGFSPFK